jgi:hypothetical protein
MLIASFASLGFFASLGPIERCLYRTRLVKTPDLISERPARPSFYFRFKIKRSTM